MAALVVSLCIGTPVTLDAHAETVAAKQARAKRMQQQASGAQSEIRESQSVVNSATSRLLESQEQLADARAELAGVSRELSSAVANDRAAARMLRAAQDALVRAKAEVAKGEAAMSAQLKVMGQAARDAYQQQNPFTGLSIVFESQTPAELAQRIQWNTTIFDSQSAEKARLDALQIELQAARDRQAAEEERVSQAKAAAAVQVQLVSDLRDRAAQQEGAVQSLVATNAKNRAAAQSELDADQAAYNAYQAQAAALQREIKAQIAKERAEAIARAKAEAARRAREEAARKAREAREDAARRAAAAKANRPYVPVKRPVVRPVAARPATSSTGFVRPVAASPGSPFGRRFHPILHYWRMHNGNDWGASCGQPLRAARSGKVLIAGRNGGYGNFVLIGHGDVNGRYVTTGYGHMSSIAVRAGQYVSTGEYIGAVGSTGLSTECHLHLELRLDGNPVNPMRYIP